MICEATKIVEFALLLGTSKPEPSYQRKLPNQVFSPVSTAVRLAECRVNAYDNRLDQSIHLEKEP
jgi:hypothetical protein